MKKLLKKLHIGSTQSEDIKNSTLSSQGNKLIKPFSASKGWLNSFSRKNSSSPPSLTNLGRVEKMENSDSASSSALEAALEAVIRDSENSDVRDHDIDEEYQIKLALELSAKEDPEAVQIEAVKQISLGSCLPENTPAEVVAYRYWKFNALGYDDKVLDGFYDLYGILLQPASSTMPSLGDLQRIPVSGNISWEAIIVDRAGDSKLLKIEQEALDMVFKSRSELMNYPRASLVKDIAALVSDHMGGPVRNPDSMLMAWRSLCRSLKASLRSIVLPLGSLKVGMARHRALLFKVLADSVGIPCRLVKGGQYTGSDDVDMNFVKIDDGREYIVDLMADPGTLIPSDAGVSHVHDDEPFFSMSPLSRDADSSQVASSSGEVTSSFEEHSGSRGSDDSRNESSSGSECNVPLIIQAEEDSKRSSLKPLRLKKDSHVRSPSWTEGVSSPSARRMKVKDVSEYMIDAAKENPQLAQRLHDVLLESGVVAPPFLLNILAPETMSPKEDTESQEREESKKNVSQGDHDQPRFLPPLPPGKYTKNVPVAAAAVAAAVASSMVVAAAKNGVDSKIEIPVAAAATATVAAMVATTAAVNKQYENLEDSSHSPEGNGEKGHDNSGTVSDGERISDRSTGSAKSDTAFDDVADCEIPWEDVTLGERIGLGSYGEVYRGDWHGTEVAVKRFLDQDVTGESLEEFKSEVQIMKRTRHPNVVLFMGALIHPPNLSIVTEFLPRGSLYRLIHRPNNQLDENRRLRMAFDTARGMNYLHKCTPVIVHRDLKTPNLLVDKNWVVKVCDFGLSRMKHNTYLSSRSTAGTAEWMAPEVLRNEPSDEKCDVYSFGVVLWELCTLQKPWGGMNPMQVVGAVGFQHRRLDIPDDMDPILGDLIRSCWQTDPKLRPSFTEIMAILKPLQVPRPSAQASRGQASRFSQEK